MYAGSLLVRRMTTAKAAKDAAEFVRKAGIIPDIKFDRKVIDSRQLDLMVRGEERFGAPDDTGVGALRAEIEQVS